MRYSIAILVLLLLFDASVSVAQDLDTIWTRQFGASESSFVITKSICSTHDNNFLAAGYCGDSSNDLDIFLVKFDSHGDTLWTKTIGDPTVSEEGMYCVSTYDYGFIITGFKPITPDNHDWSLVKTDPEGNSIWERVYHLGDPQSRSYFVEETTDKGFIMCGYSGDDYSSRGDRSVVIVKTDSLGEGELSSWEWISKFDINGNQDNRSYCVRQTVDGGFIVAGATGSSDVMDMFLLKLDQVGDSVWCQSYESPGGESWGRSVAQASDGGYLVVGQDGVESLPHGIYVVKTDGGGNVLYSWQYQLGSDCDLYSVNRHPAGGFIASGQASGDALLMRLDDIGDTLWTFVFGTSEQEYAQDVYASADEQYYTAGWVMVPTEVYLAKVGYLPSYICGDANVSGAVDIDDVVYLIAYIFSGGPEPVPYESGDTNCSGGVDIDDVVYLISYIFSGGFAPCDPDGNGTPDC